MAATKPRRRRFARWKTQPSCLQDSNTSLLIVFCLRMPLHGADDASVVPPTAPRPYSASNSLVPSRRQYQLTDLRIRPLVLSNRNGLQRPAHADLPHVPDHAPGQPIDSNLVETSRRRARGGGRGRELPRTTSVVAPVGVEGFPGGGGVWARGARVPSTP